MSSSWRFGKREEKFFNLHSSLSFILGSARRIFLAAAVATTATLTAQAAWVWTGNGTDAYWSTTDNWNTSAAGPGYGAWFRDGYTYGSTTVPIRISDGKYTVSFNSNVTFNNPYFVVDSGSTLATPFTFTATAAANGLSNNKGALNIGTDGSTWGDGYLSILSGTYSFKGVNIGSSTSKGWLSLGTTSGGPTLTSSDTTETKINNGELIVNGGTLNASSHLWVGNGGTGTSGTLTINGGTVNVSKSGNKWVSISAGSSGTINLNGGELQTVHIHGRTDATMSLVFNGGTLVAAADYTSNEGLIHSAVDVTVAAGNGTIDVNNKDNILVSAAIGGTGGMTFKGGGTITLSGASTYTGGTTVELGTKLVASTDAARDAILGKLIVDGLKQVTAQKFTVFEYSGGGLSKDNVSFVNCGPATYAEVDGNTIVVHFDPGWVGTSAAVKVFPGQTLSDIEYGIFTSRFGGLASSDDNRYTPNSAGGYNVKRYYDDGDSVTNMVVEFQVKDANTVKCVVVEFTDDGTDVYAKALGGRAKDEVNLGYVFLEQNRTTWNGDGPYDVVTNITDWYYGVFDLRVKLPVSWTLDANKNWSTLRNGATLASDEIVRIKVTGGEKKHTLTVDEDVDIGQIMFVDGSGAILEIATDRTLEADSITGLGFVLVDSGAMLYVDGTVDATSLKNNGTVVKRVADDVYMPVHNGSTGTTIVSNRTLKVSKKYASGTTHTIRVVSGARFDMNGVQDVTAKFVLENGATFANTGAEIDGKKAQAVSLTLEGNATAEFSDNFGLIGPSYGETTLALGSNTLTLNGSNKDFWLCKTEITGDGTIYVEHGWLHPTNTASVGAACTLNIPSGGALNLEADLTVANFVNGANDGNIKGGNTLTVTGQLTPGSAAIPKLTLASGATVKATGTEQKVSLAFSASGTINIDISDISQQVRDAGDEGISVLTVPTVPAGVRWNVTGADNFRAKWVGNTLYVVKSDGLMVIIR